jgi:uncharacterized protein (TIGR02996 family)
MDQQTAFLLAILEAPADDVPRLVFSDWLQDRGELWGEFIRAQCDRNGADRAAELIPQLWKTVLAPVKRYLDPESVTFERGFIQTACARPGMKPASIIALATCPLLAPLLWTSGLDVDRFGNIPPLQKVIQEGTLNFFGQFSQIGMVDGGVLAAGYFPGLPRVTSLELGFLCLRDEIVTPLAECPNLADLTNLDFGSDHDGDGWDSSAITAASVKALVNSPHLANLTRLSLLWNFQVGDNGVRAIVASPHLKRLTHLDLSGTGLTDAGVRTLARSPFLERLTTLRLWHNSELGDAAAQALASSPHVGNLRELDLRGWREAWTNGIGDAGALALANSPHLDGLRQLHVGYWRDLTPAGLAALRDKFGDRLVYDE